MLIEEVDRIANWAINLSEEHGFGITKVMQVFQAINKHHGIEETRNLMEIGIILLNRASGK